MTLTCRTCGQAVPVPSVDGVHDIVYRLNTVDGPGPFPFWALHSPWAAPQDA